MHPDDGNAVRGMDENGAGKMDWLRREGLRKNVFVQVALSQIQAASALMMAGLGLGAR